MARCCRAYRYLKTAVVAVVLAAVVVPGGGQAAAAVPGWSAGVIPSGPTPNDRGSAPAALSIGGKSYVFWYEDQTDGPGGTIGSLLYASHDGTRWTRVNSNGLDGAFSSHGVTDAGAHPVALSYNGQPHLFYLNLDDNPVLRHGWFVAGTWHFENLPGPGPSPRGPVAAAVYRGAIHLWYGTAGNRMMLGHSWMAGGSWRQEILDGAGGTSGRITADVGEHATVEIDHGLPHVFYYNASSGNLRQAWWTGTRWQFATLDGTPGAAGRADGDMGRAASAVNDGGVAHVYYYDATRGNLRQAWWNRTHWQFATLDGAASTPGGHADDVGSAVTAAARHVFYYDADTGDLRQAWYDTTARHWRFAVLDGAGGARAQTTNDVGQRATIAVDSAGTKVYYHDATTNTFRYTWWR